MADEIWLFVALGIGFPLLLGATVLDVRRRRRELGPPLRTGDPLAPAYLTQEDVDALPSPAGPADSSPPHGTLFGFGFAHPDFRTHGRSARWDDATVLVVDGDLHDMRLLTGPWGRLPQGAPLVVVASSMAPVVVETLAANRRVLHMAVLACLASPEDLAAVARWCGAEPLSGSDLAAGYLPQEALGTAQHWVSEAECSWVEPGPARLG